MSRVARADVSLTELPVTLTKAELAKVLRRSERWIEEQVADGTLPIPRIKRAPGLLWSREAVERFLRDITFTPPEPAAEPAAGGARRPA